MTKLNLRTFGVTGKNKGMNNVVLPYTARIRRKALVTGPKNDAYYGCQQSRSPINISGLLVIFISNLSADKAF